MVKIYVVCELRLKKPHQIDLYYFPSKFLLADLWKLVFTKEEADKYIKDWADYQEEEMGSISRYDHDQHKYVPIWVGEPVHKHLSEHDDHGRDWEIETFENYPEYMVGYTIFETSIKCQLPSCEERTDWCDDIHKNKTLLPCNLKPEVTNS
jgi:hypothetical protein